MTPAEVADLLRFCSSVDSFLRQTSPEEAAVMIGGWGTILADVDAGHAMKTAKAHYSVPQARTIQPGDLLGAWRDNVRAMDREATETRTRELVGPQEALMPRPSMVAWLRDAMHALTQGTPPEDIPRPVGGVSLSPKADAFFRRCTYHAICACEHVHCRDGWMDAEERVTSQLGRAYPAVRRCPLCNDALLMAEERGIAKKPSTATARRR